MAILSEQEVQRQLNDLKDWTLEGRAIRKQYTFSDFPAAVAFVNRLAEASEAANHHPDITISWNAVTVRWWTHVKRAITETDVEMARRTDELAASSSGH